MTKTPPKTTTSKQPGPVYDSAVRGVMAGDPVAACRLLNIPITTPSGVPQILPTSFPIATKSADLLLRVGPGRLAHVEYVRRATTDLVARGSPSEHARCYEEALRLIHKEGGPRARELLTFATELAAITLDRSIIRTIIEEVGMTVEDEAEFFRDLPWGQTLIRTGIEQGLEQSLVWRLEERFGTDAEVRAIAHRLATWPDHASAFRAITAAESLAELANTEPPQ